jgi:hypothetical protein
VPRLKFPCKRPLSPTSLILFTQTEQPRELHMSRNTSTDVGAVGPDVEWIISLLLVASEQNRREGLSTWIFLLYPIAVQI